MRVDIFGPRIWFKTKSRIEAGEEICFDYGKSFWKDHPTPPA